MTDFLDLLLQPCRLLRSIQQEVKRMNASMDTLTREVGETDVKVDAMAAVLGTVVADLAAANAKLDALKDAPTPEQLDALSADLDALQGRAQAAMDAINPPAPEPAPEPAPGV